MTVTVSLPILRIPPFPNATCGLLARAGSFVTDARSDSEIDAIAEALACAKVGGTYWASRPPIPNAPYTLVRIANSEVRDRTIASLGTARLIVCWADLPPERSPQPAPHVSVITGAVDPWHVLGGAVAVVVDSDDSLALLAAVSGVALTCLGDGRFESLGECGPAALRDVLRRHLVDDIRYVDPFTGEDMTPLAAIDRCGFWRSLIDRNRDIAAAIGFAFWKRPTVAPLLWNGSSKLAFEIGPKSMPAGQSVAVWRSRAKPAVLAELHRRVTPMIEVEDGFIRSTGLGADCVPPLSIIIDRTGVYFDPSGPSDLEQLLQNGKFAPEMLDRARRLRELIVAAGISKYGGGAAPIERRDYGKRYLLVPGQVEDDRSVTSGGGGVSTNLELLRRVRAANADAHILYKPHPDVEAGHRVGAIADDICLGLADEIVRSAPISSLIDVVDEVHVNTSLAGFEALLRGKPVTTYGVPFYAGWGLAQDLGMVPPRRTARRTLDEVVAATLLLYPRYLDPVTGLPCPPEILIKRLSEGEVGQAFGPVVWLRRLQGRANRALAKIWSR